MILIGAKEDPRKELGIQLEAARDREKCRYLHGPENEALRASRGTALRREMGIGRYVGPMYVEPDNRSRLLDELGLQLHGANAVDLAVDVVVS